MVVGRESGCIVSKGRVMAIKSEVENVGDYLRMKSSGTLDSVEEVELYMDTIRLAALSKGVKKVLLDERNLMQMQDAHEAYELSESEATRLTALAGIRLSSVCNPDNYDLNKTYETFLMNRSLIFKVFLDEQEAIDWLIAS